MSSRKRPRDSRHYIAVSVDIFDNPKLTEVDQPIFDLAYIRSLVIAGKTLSDGHISPARIMREVGGENTAVTLDGRRMPLLEALYKQGLWHPRGHDCDRCPQPKNGQAVVHDYLRHNRSKEEWNQHHQSLSERGRKGAQQRWSPEDDDEPGRQNPLPAVATAMATGMAAGMATAISGGSGMDAMNSSLARTPPEPPPRRPATRRTRVPEDFTITATMRHWAATNTPGIDIDHQTRTFLKDAAAQGKAMSDWQSAWQTWMLRALSFVRQRSTSPAGTHRYQVSDDPMAAMRAAEQQARHG